MSHSIEIFLAAHRAMIAGIHMTPRSANDKEYFPQDWFADRVDGLGLPLMPQGRNSYPDFWVGDDAHAPVEGYEIKSLAFNHGRPARKDYDSNSTIPSGRKDGRDVFLVFFLYTGSGASPRPVQSLCIAHGDLINADHAVAAAHVNEAIRGFGSYGEGFIRDRKMYVFPHPLTVYPAGIGRCSLILPADWDVSDPRLARVGSLERVVADESLQGYRIHLDGKTPADKQTMRRSDAGQQRRFHIYESC
ncbi:hypothetical protein [Imhoffiella purpurea]|uniref:Restriction endonuclease n=1 Tax=Imhoffiella purpurea TaxID=1249627 RepID=W9VUY0_9GAMM|nr:hypothetical protein [Imhoffiella purpurea]EXJ14200.1 hypothetical protein D779_2871 [Imhoffiella purpurea]